MRVVSSTNEWGVCRRANATKQKSHILNRLTKITNIQFIGCLNLNKMKFSAALAIGVFLIVVQSFCCTLTTAHPPNEKRNGINSGGGIGRPKNNWKNEICIELGHLLLEAEKINELKHCSTTITDIRNGINERVTTIRQILNNHGALCDAGANADGVHRGAPQHAQRGKFNKNSFDWTFQRDFSWWMLLNFFYCIEWTFYIVLCHNNHRVNSQNFEYCF